MKNILFFACLLLTLTSFSQTGPGGVGNSSNNVIWLNGDIYTLATSPYISSWLDQSGNGNDFSQATATKQPRVVGYAGFKGIRFDGGDYITNAGIAALNTNTNTHYVVYNGYRPNHVGFLFNASFTQNNQYITAYRNNGNIRSWVLNSSLGIVDNTTTNSSSFQIISSVWDGVGQTFNSYKDGTSIGSKSGANGNPTGNYFNIIGASANGSYRFDGDMSELIVYNTALNSAQRTIVDNYLSSKFATTISNDKYSYDATHKYQVIGIGAEADGNNLTAQGAGIVELSIGSMASGEYVLAGHDNTSLSLTTTDVPAAIAPGSRETRVWRADVTGSPGIVTVVYNVSSLPLPAGSYYLLVDADGVFNAGATSYGPFADVGGLVSFSGVTLTAGDYFTIASGTDAGIISTQTGFWDVASTWSCSCVPTSTDSVVISTGHTITARTAITINDVTINGNLSTTLTSTFNITGNLIVNAGGTFTNKTVTFNGTSAQTITNASSTVDFATLVINNSAGISISSGNFSVSNSVRINSGLFQNVGGTFTFLSTASKTAVILNSVGSFAGSFIVQRYISQRNAGWGDLSSPVSNNHLRDWDSNPAGTARELLMCGVSGFSGSCGGWNSVYSFDAATQTYPAITDTGYVLSPGSGIELWLADDDSLLYNTTFDSRGTPNYGNVAVPVVNSFNLVGNPYQAFVNFNSLTKPTINSTYYIWSTASGTYDAKTAGQIPPHQGFYVESVGSGTLTFTESSKNGSGASTFYKTTPQEEEEEDVEPYAFTEAILKVKNNQLNYAHELKLRINELSKTSLDEFDASFLPSRIVEAPSITAFSEKSNKPLAIVSFNLANEVIVPISIKTGVIGQLTIEAINFENFTNFYKNVTLLDTKTNTIYNFKTQKEVTVDLTTEEDDARFELRLSNNIASANVGDLNVTIYKNQEFTVIERNDVVDGYTVSIVNLLGQKVIDDFVNITTNRLLIPNNSLPKGVNMISVKDKNNSIIKKLIY